MVALDPANGVICTHGELMRPLLDGLRGDGTQIRSVRPDDDWLLRKGTAWTLTLDARNTVVTLDHQVPPDLPHCPEHADYV